MHKNPIAIILAAGKGIRLQPLTKEIPKPLIEVNNVPILFHTLECLKKLKIDKCIIVVGYKAKLFQELVDSKYKHDIDITYITNKDFDKTNNMYSLWLASDYLSNNDCILIEADVLFDYKILSSLDFRNPTSFWLVDKFKENMNGALLITDKTGKIEKIKIVREKLLEYKNNYYKSIGILKIKKDLGKKLSAWLNKEVTANNKNIYYDLVIAKYLKEANLFVKYINNLKWWEIDDESDLKYAQKLFK